LALKLATANTPRAVIRKCCCCWQPRPEGRPRKCPRGDLGGLLGSSSIEEAIGTDADVVVADASFITTDAEAIVEIVAVVDSSSPTEFTEVTEVTEG